MVKISSYFSQKERDTIDQYREDMSRSLFIRRAIRKVITEEEEENNDQNNNENVVPSSLVGGSGYQLRPTTSAAVEEVVKTAVPPVTKESEAL